MSMNVHGGGELLEVMPWLQDPLSKTSESEVV